MKTLNLINWKFQLIRELFAFKRLLFILACLPAINSRNERGTVPESTSKSGGLQSDLFEPATSYTRSRSESYDLARNNRRLDCGADLKIIPVYAFRWYSTHTRVISDIRTTRQCVRDAKISFAHSIFFSFSRFPSSRSSLTPLYREMGRLWWMLENFTAASNERYATYPRSSYSIKDTFTFPNVADSFAQLNPDVESYTQSSSSDRFFFSSAQPDNKNPTAESRDRFRSNPIFIARKRSISFSSRGFQQIFKLQIYLCSE